MQIIFKIHKHFFISTNSQPNSKVSGYFREGSVAVTSIFSANFQFTFPLAKGSVRPGSTQELLSAALRQIEFETTALYYTQFWHEPCSDSFTQSSIAMTMAQFLLANHNTPFARARSHNRTMSTKGLNVMIC